MIIFESILTTFIASIANKDRWDNIENWLELKIKAPKANLAYLYRWNTLYHKYETNLSFVLLDQKKREGGETKMNEKNYERNIFLKFHLG